MDRNRLEGILVAFAKQYKVLLWKEVENLFVKSKPIFTKKQRQMDGQTFVQLMEYMEQKETRYTVVIGKIVFCEDERVSIDTHPYSVFVPVSDEETLMETILEKYKEYQKDCQI